MSPTRAIVERPLVINERRPILIPAAVLVSIITAAICATWGYAELSNRVSSAAMAAGEAKTAVAKQDERVRELESTQERMANDIGWIRRMMEEDRANRNQPSITSNR